MKAVMKTAPEPGIQIGELPVPKISPEEVLIRVRAVGICGSDVHVYEWARGYERLYENLISYMPVVLGHEFSGEVVEVGGQVTGVRPGDRVTYGGLACGQCPYCIAGRHSLCIRRATFGTRQGAMAEYIAVSGNPSALHRIPAGVSFEEAAMSQPTTEALHILEQGQISLGDPVVILGAGPIALTVAQAAKASGASPVVITGLSQDRERLSLAKSFGVDEAIDVEKEDPVEKVRAMTGGLGAATVFEISGSGKAFNQGLDLLRKGGTLVAFGIYPDEISVDVTRKVVREMKSIRGVYGGSWLARSKVLNLMASGQLRLAPLITHRLPLEAADEGFRACLGKKAMKVMLFPG